MQYLIVTKGKRDILIIPHDEAIDADMTLRMLDLGGEIRLTTYADLAGKLEDATVIDNPTPAQLNTLCGALFSEVIVTDIDED